MWILLLLSKIPIRPSLKAVALFVQYSAACLIEGL
jgi:hypothetical protein